ncbi:AAA family ATPase [Solwaraspora sp. WMMD1047]|uniref:AAA family ATPase n=1 Tax=Solwaraspora sp. WMMD1047 TaxID=3016102 RepID=UPI0024163269|nr:ATP-binding protein [Solwaraspora sp. WMMD1047]MDG4829272.1 AAA family ATPase [Solwaraspora sp. WMMD1047]
MRLESLYITSWKNLQDFEIHFSDVPTTVLVGQNGTGKSNVLEALIIIFRDLDLGAPPLFAFKLAYRCKGKSIRVDCDPARRGRTAHIEVDGERWRSDRFSRKGGGEYLPGFVFGYYSGPSNRMERHFESHQVRFASDLREGVDRPLRPLLYARLVHSQFVLLSFFARESGDREVLTRFLRIVDLDSVLFVLKKPSWFNPNRGSDPANPGDPRIWGARGVVRDFASRLYRIALAPMRGRRGSERLYLYLKDKKDLLALADGYDNQAEFFKALESLYISDLIEDVRTRVTISGSDDALTFRELSEGEQQLLTVLGLLRFVEGQEGLILLDEPDTHLNPSWSLDYTYLLKTHVSDPDSANIVMATHDPLVVSALTRDEVRVMRRGEADRIHAAVPEEDPRGMGVAGLLTSQLYGLRSQLDRETLNALDRKRDLASLDTLTPEQRVELSSLNDYLANLDFSRTTRDPLYKPYVSAMTVLENHFALRKATLTPGEIDRRQDLANEVVRSLLERLEAEP